jgi:hypothetical protein
MLAAPAPVQRCLASLDFLDLDLEVPLGEHPVDMAYFCRLRELNGWRQFGGGWIDSLAFLLRAFEDGGYCLWGISEAQIIAQISSVRLLFMLCTGQETERNGMEWNRIKMLHVYHANHASLCNLIMTNAMPLLFVPIKKKVMTRNKKSLITFPTLLIHLTPQYSQTDLDPAANPYT